MNVILQEQIVSTRGGGGGAKNTRYACQNVVIKAVCKPFCWYRPCGKSNILPHIVLAIWGEIRPGMVMQIIFCFCKIYKNQSLLRISSVYHDNQTHPNWQYLWLDNCSSYTFYVEWALKFAKLVITISRYICASNVRLGGVYVRYI